MCLKRGMVSHGMGILKEGQSFVCVLKGGWFLTVVLKDGWSLIRDLKRRVASSWHFKMGVVSHTGLTSWVVSWYRHHERGIVL